MSLKEGFGVGFRWVVGVVFLWKIKEKGEGAGEGGVGVGWGPEKEPASQCACFVSQCSATVRHCSCYTRCSATPFYDIDMANLRCYTPPKRTEAAATMPFFKTLSGV